eukprot:scaffold2065_cov114-Isochrysis_galbana.AAC.7
MGLGQHRAWQVATAPCSARWSPIDKARESCHSHLEKQFDSSTVQLFAADRYSIHDSIQGHRRARVAEDGMQQLQLFSPDTGLKHCREVAKLQGSNRLPAHVRREALAAQNGAAVRR